MFTYTVPGEPYFNTAQNTPNTNLEGNWPQVSGSTSNPLLLYYGYRRILYINNGGSRSGNLLFKSGRTPCFRHSPNHCSATSFPCYRLRLSILPARHSLRF